MKAYSCLVSNGNNRKIPIKGGGAFFNNVWAGQNRVWVCLKSS